MRMRPCHGWRRQPKRSGDSDSEDEADEEMEESDGDELELTYESEDNE